MSGHIHFTVKGCVAEGSRNLKLMTLSVQKQIRTHKMLKQERVFLFFLLEEDEPVYTFSEYNYYAFYKAHQTVILQENGENRSKLSYDHPQIYRFSPLFSFVKQLYFTVCCFVKQSELLHINLSCRKEERSYLNGLCAMIQNTRAPHGCVVCPVLAVTCPSCDMS